MSCRSSKRWVRRPSGALTWLVPWLQKMSREEVAALYAKLAARIDDGTIRVPVEATFPMEAIRDAVAHANAYQRRGKVLVMPNGPV